MGYRGRGTIDEALRLAEARRKESPQHMLPLLTTDWHLTDDPDDEYRWGIVEQVMQAIIQYHVEIVFILGDVVDRKDRHSGALVNRLVEALQMIAGRVPVVLLRGNHDTPLRGPAFWEFLSAIANIYYITVPTTWHVHDTSRPDLLLLPFDPHPLEAWRGIKFTDYRALFMHATVTGAVVENGIVMENSHFPILPRSVEIYSGDVHVPQTVGNITYVGAPHPIKFGDKYQGRMLLLDERFAVKQVLLTASLNKYMLDIASIEELHALKPRPGDQVKIRLGFSGSVTDWGRTEAAIQQWAAAHGVVVASTEIAVESVYNRQAADPEQSPEQILKAFAKQERMAEPLLAIGLALLEEVR